MREVAHGKRGKAYNCKENNRFIGCLQAFSVFLICSLISLFCAAAGTSVQVLRILHMARDGSDVPLLDVPTLHTLKYTCRRAVLLRCTFRQKMPSSPPLKFHVFRQSWCLSASSPVASGVLHSTPEAPYP